MKVLLPPSLRHTIWTCCCLLLIAGNAGAQTVRVWETQALGNQRLTPLDSIELIKDLAKPPAGDAIKIQTEKHSQSIAGFGFTLTQGSAVAIMKLDEEARGALLNELFSDQGLAISMLRVGVGATDLSTGVYSYNEHAGDTTMEHFSLDGPDRDSLLPLMKQIQAIRPTIKWMATPWTAPTWMKTNQAWIGGSLRPEHYRDYANYLVAYLKTMRNEGLEIWALTPQNEPENDHNEPSMLMTAEQQFRFIDQHLGPAIENAGLSTKILAFDHNCDHPDYPIHVLQNTKYAAGAAFHLYAGKIDAMTTVHDATGKDVYFTEQWTSSEGDFGGDLHWHLINVVVGSLRNHSRSVLEWNLANLSDFSPHTPGGCDKCAGAITVLDAQTVQRNVSYYVIGHLSKFIRPGAIRVASDSDNANLHQVALTNPDGSTVLVALNNGPSALRFTVTAGGKHFVTEMPSGSVRTYVW